MRSVAVRRVARSCARRSFPSSTRLSPTSSHANMCLRHLSNKNPAESENAGDEFGEWIPPDRPLVGDKGDSHLYERHDDVEEDDDEFANQDLDEEDLLQLELELEAAAEELEEKQISSTGNAEEPVDWLQTRRSKQQLEGVDVMMPGSGKVWEDADVEVISHTLLTANEITTCLSAMGGKEITVIPNTHDRRMGSASGMILVTGSSPAQIFLLADTLVRQLKRRELADVGVVGAQLGAEGSDDKFDTWRVVDCLNYTVHILDASTREYLDLETLWLGNDPLLHVSMYDDDDIDDYVAANPVPAGYGALDANDWSRSISQMQRNRWIVPHRPVAGTQGKGKRGKRKRGRRR